MSSIDSKVNALIARCDVMISLTEDVRKFSNVSAKATLVRDQLLDERLQLMAMKSTAEEKGDKAA